MLKRIIDKLRGKKPIPTIADWFSVTFDELAVHVSATPPGKEPWSQSFDWADVIRVCFKAEGLYASDGIYIFTSKRPESYAIPTEAQGGSALWGEIIHRNLFPADLAITAASSESGFFVWPPHESSSNA